MSGREVLPLVEGGKGISVSNGESSGAWALAGGVGTFSPDGNNLLYPEFTIISAQERPRTHFKNIDLETQQIEDLIPYEDSVDENEAAWSPDGSKLVITRRYTDDRYTEGWQIYLLNLENNTVEPLVVDPSYKNVDFFWDPSGQQLVIQRFPAVADGSPTGASIWTYEIETKKLTQVITNAFNPRWVP